MARNATKGTYYPQEETVEAVREAFPWTRVEEGRDDYVRAGNEFSHPMAEEPMSADLIAMQAPNVNPDTPLDVLRQGRDAFADFGRQQWEAVNEAHPEFEEFGWWEEYDVAEGCPEEPDAPAVHVVVRRLRGDGPFPVIFVSPTGGLLMNGPHFSTSAPMSKYLGAQLVSVQHRTYADAPYPATINDMHAAYQWMVRNAKELNVDLDRVILAGWSSGGGVVTALAFRLKRYDWCGAPCPRGILTYDAFLDDREVTHSMRMIDRTWSGVVNRGANMRYMGTNFSSGFVGPEAFANHATVDECRGLPPVVMYQHQDSPGCDPAIQFTRKLNDADVYCSLQMQGGNTHMAEEGAGTRVTPFMPAGEDYVPQAGIDVIGRAESYVIGNLKDLIDIDLRR